MCGLIAPHFNREEKLVMSESLDAIFQHVIWNFCYLSVLLGLSAFGIHRYFIIYLFLKNRRKRIEPAQIRSGSCRSSLCSCLSSMNTT